MRDVMLCHVVCIMYTSLERRWIGGAACVGGDGKGWGEVLTEWYAHSRNWHSQLAYAFSLDIIHGTRAQHICPSVSSLSTSD